MNFILTLTIILLAVGIWEKYRHQSQLNKIAIRIHVNGTRGKSLLVRMLVDLFQLAGYSVMAKVTGEQPHIFHPQEGWRPWCRRAPARIKEQMHFIKLRSRLNPDVLILENMALLPENQFISESRMVRSHLSVYTNFREDHQEVIGKTRAAVVRALACSFPKNSTVLLPEKEMTSFIQSISNRSKSKFIATQVHPLINSKSLPVFNSQFALLQAIQTIYNIPLAALEQTIDLWQVRLQADKFILPLPGNNYLVNLFTCNDVTSANGFIDSLEASRAIHPPYDIVLTCRADRPMRTVAFLKGLLPSLQWQRLILAGAFPSLTINRILHSYKKLSHQIIIKKNIIAEDIVTQLNDGSEFVLGLGNYVKTGDKIISYLTKD